MKIQHKTVATYVKNSPERLRGVIVENVHYEYENKIHKVLVFRGLESDVRLPLVESFEVHDKYITITYDDGCICFCYEIDQPIRSHRNLERYSMDDSFLLL